MSGSLEVGSRHDLRTGRSPDAPEATTACGKIRGARSEGINVFKGIPYGASTAGANRFRAPKPPEPWSGVRAARCKRRVSKGNIGEIRYLAHPTRPEPRTRSLSSLSRSNSLLRSINS